MGLGPGGREHLTEAARAALEAAQVVVGYRSYVEAVESLLAEKPKVVGGMRSERERAKTAVDLARQGCDVAVVSGGDAGIYGMAGLVLEMLSPDDVFPVEVVPGVTAASAAAARLGAPLMNDFAVISLSDLLTPLSTIERRLKGAIAGDLVIALYNPRGTRRTKPLVRALELLREARAPDTPVGVVRNVTRSGEEVMVTTLAELDIERLDMSSMVIVGNSDTVVLGGRMITRRGYPVKEKQ